MSDDEKLDESLFEDVEPTAAATQDDATDSHIVVPVPIISGSDDDVLTERPETAIAPDAPDNALSEDEI